MSALIVITEDNSLNVSVRHTQEIPHTNVSLTDLDSVFLKMFEFLLKYRHQLRSRDGGAFVVRAVFYVWIDMNMNQ